MIWDEGLRTTLHSVQRFLIKRIFLPRSGTGQAKPEWPASADWPPTSLYQQMLCPTNLSKLRNTSFIKERFSQVGFDGFTACKLPEPIFESRMK
ncbi:hypothetical protein RJ60_11785 [Mesotoga sp. B105.6.4]|nr:hypothetical protein RJ60_11785 [Mesotoga sp. B105.6.4]